MLRNRGRPLGIPVIIDKKRSIDILAKSPQTDPVREFEAVEFQALRSGCFLPIHALREELKHGSSPDAFFIFG